MEEDALSNTSSNSTIIDDVWSNNKSLSENSAKSRYSDLQNFYDLNEFEEPHKESLDYLSDFFPTSSSAMKKKSDFIVISSSSDEDTEYLKEIVDSKHKNNREIDLNKDNTIFETHDFPSIIPRNTDNHKVEDMCITEPTTTKGKEKKPKKVKYPKKTKAIISENAQKITEKHKSADKSLKDVIVNVDESVFGDEDYGDCIKNYLENNGVSCRIRPSLPGLMVWSRKISTEENSVTHQMENDEKYYLLILMHNQCKPLMQIIQTIKNHTNFHHLTILLYGLNKPTVAQENEILEVEMSYSTLWKFVKNREELASSIYIATKSIAQIPYKMEQEDKYKLQSEYFDDSNKDVVKVNQMGNGLGRLWRQMLTMFPLAGLETAEAITSVYPTLSSLFKAYDECTDQGEKLIQDLPIRRAYGPLASTRKLGPELSRKCYKFFTSTENTLL